MIIKRIRLQKEEYINKPIKANIGLVGIGFLKLKGLLKNQTFKLLKILLKISPFLGTVGFFYSRQKQS